MAIAKIAAPLAGLRGTVGGIVYSANGAGPYVRSWSMPPNPRTQPQQLQRSDYAGLPANWRALTAAQKTAWDTFAALPAQDLKNSLGLTYSASGVNWYTKCNSRLLRAGRAILATTPTQARPAAPTIDDFRVTPAGSDPNLATGGTPSASTEDPSYPASNAFDGSVLPADEWRTATGNPTGWLEYDFGVSVEIRKYRIYSSSADGNTNPKDWALERWTGAAWSSVQAVSSVVLASVAWFDFYVPSSSPSQRWRINITANNGSASLVRLRELEMFAATASASVIVYPEDSFADTPDYDFDLHIAQGPTTGRQVYHSNFRETLVTQSPGRWFVEFQSELDTLLGQIQPNRSFFARLFRQTTQGLRSAPASARSQT